MAGSSSTSSSDRARPASQGRELRRVVSKLAIFALVLGALDFAIGSVLHRLYYSQTSGLFAETTYIVDHMQAPVVIVGSSRALHHYVPSVMSGPLGLSCYNAGRDGQSVLFSAAMLEQMFARYRPKVVILDLNVRDLEHDAKAYDRLSELLPYVREHESIRRYVDLRGPFERVKLLSRTYPFNSMILSIVQHNVVRSLGTKRDSGYIALRDDLAKRPGEVNPMQDLPATPIDPVKRDALLRVVALAKSAGTRLQVIVSPLYSGDRATQWRAAMARLLATAGVSVWDYTDDPEFRSDPHLFSDEVHLNHTGAVRFSALVAARLAAERAREGP
jgi:hypothetical protein